MINNKFFLETHSFLKKIAIDIIIPNIGKLSKNEVSTKKDNSKVTSYDVIIENELIDYFKNIGFSNIISEEGNSELIKKNEYLTVDPIDGTRNFINGINKVAIMLSFIKSNHCEFAIIYDPIGDVFYHTHKNSIFKNHKQIKPQNYSNQIGFLGEHAKIYFKDIISSYTEKLRSRSIGYDVIEAIEGERSFLTVYGSKIWDLFPAMSFLKLLNFETNLPNMEFDYSKLEKKIIFYANL
jgi:fructose-1,6-bisphosphatase/inositol monophosphatase family enzyme